MTARLSVRPILATVLALILIVLSIASSAGAQQPATIPTVGWFAFGSEEGALDGFRQGLRELSYVEGQNIAIVSRRPEGNGRSSG
jgi:hypothetical protein